MKKQTVAVIDDNGTMLAHLAEIVSSDRTLELVGAGKDGEDALELIRELQPDVLLLDMIMPKLDGLEVLERLSRDKTLRHKPEVIVVSAVGSEGIINKAFALGAAYYIRKPFSDETILSRIHQLEAKEEPKLPKPAAMRIAPVPYQQEDLETEVTHMLHEIGVPAHVRGYQYLRDAIIIAVGDRNAVNAITKILYPAIAKMNMTTPTRVERAIRHAIEISWERGNIEAITRIFGHTTKVGKGKSTNAEFIALLADNIRIKRKTRNNLLS